MLKGRERKKRFVGIRQKMLVLFSVVIILSNAFILSFAVTRYSAKLEENNLRNSEQILANLIRNLADYIGDLERISDLAIYNYYIQDYLISLDRGNPNYQNVEMGVALLGNIISTRNDISAIFIFDEENVALYKTSPLSIDTSFDFQSQIWHQRAVAQPDDIFVSGPGTPVYALRPSPEVISVSRSINRYDGSGTLGVILIDATMDTIKSFCDSVKPNNDGFIFVTDTEGNVLYHPNNLKSPNPTLASTYSDLYKNIVPQMSAQTGTFNADINNQSYQMVYREMDKTGWHVIAATPLLSIRNDANAVRDLVILVGFICLVLVVLVSLLLSNGITKPIIELKNSMDKAEHGSLDLRVPEYASDEVGLLSTSFNHMLARIELLMHQVVVDQEEKRKLELTALQHQVNPHFLYNTLDSIIWMAEAKDENVVPMTEALSKLFRISLSKGNELIPLSSELEHVRNYLFIQSMRYLNKFDYVIEAEDYLLSCKTIKLILQPLVENSIYHGIKSMTGRGHIRIVAKEAEGCLRIAVQDNGIGMDAAALAGILTAVQVDPLAHGSGFGVRNVDERIKLYFGNDYGLRFESTPGEGTTAWVTLPLELDWA